MSRCTHGFRLQITLLNLSHRVPTPSVEPGTLPMDLLLQLENTYGLTLSPFIIEVNFIINL